MHGQAVLPETLQLKAALAIPYIIEDKLLNLLPPPPDCLDYVCATRPVYMILGYKPKALHRLGKHSTA